MAGNIISVVGYGRSSINYKAKQFLKAKQWENIKIKQVIKQIIASSYIPKEEIINKETFGQVWNGFINIEYQPGRVGLKSEWNKRFVEYLKEKEFQRYKKRQLKICQIIKNKRRDYDFEDVF